MTTINNITGSVYPLKNSSLQLHFTTVPGSEVLGLDLISGDDQLRIPIGNYSVQSEIWHYRNNEISIGADLLNEILTLAKSYAIARAVRFGNLKTLANETGQTSDYKQ